MNKNNVIAMILTLFVLGSSLLIIKAITGSAKPLQYQYLEQLKEINEKLKEE